MTLSGNQSSAAPRVMPAECGPPGRQKSPRWMISRAVPRHRSRHGSAKSSTLVELPPIPAPRLLPSGKLHQALAVCVLLVAVAVAGAAASAAQPDGPPAGLELRWSDAGLTYSSAIRTTPRPLRIHVLELEFESPRYEPVVVVSADPDGAGPAEAKLEKPERLAEAAHLVAAVNASPFGGLPDATGKRSEDWRLGMPVELLGWAVADAEQRSGVQPGWPNFWIDEAGRGRVKSYEATKQENPPVWQAVGGFGMILAAGTIRVDAGGALQPRTAVGVDGEGKTMWLVVVDGRQPGFSEGMSEHELATLMQQVGCSDGLNLDGGGSSIMLVSDPRDDKRPPIQAVNSPSGWSRRPLPMLLGVRRKAE